MEGQGLGGLMSDFVGQTTYDHEHHSSTIRQWKNSKLKSFETFNPMPLFHYVLEYLSFYL